MSIHVPLRTFGFAGMHYGFLIALGLIGYVIGRQAMRVRFGSRLEKLVFGAGLGLGILSYLIFSLGLLHALYREVVIALLLLLGLLCRPAWRELLNDLRGWYGEVIFRRRIVWLLSCIPLSIALVAPLYPPTDWDSLSYHLAVAKIAATTHAVELTPYLRFPTFPLGSEMLSALALLLYDDIAARMVQFLAMLLVGGAIFAWGRRLFGTTAGAIAAALWFSNVLVLWLGASADSDIVLTLFCTLAIFALWNWGGGAENQQWLLLSAVFFGFAAGTKYPALFLICVACFHILHYSERSQKIKNVLVFGSIAAAIASPWYIRNFYYTHNPVFPFLPRVFGYSFWSPNDFKYVAADLHHWGTGRTLHSFFSLPWNLAFHQNLFHAEARVSPMYLLLLPIVLLFGLRNRSLVVLAGWVLAYTIFWFRESQITRYLLPILPLLGLVEAGALSALLDWLFRKTRRPRWEATLLWLFLAGVLGTGWLQNPGWFFRGPVPVTAFARQEYFTTKLPSYAFFQLLNKSEGTNYSIYGDEPNMAYFADGQFMGDLFGPARYSDVLGLPDGLSLYWKLKALKARYLLVSLNFILLAKSGDGNALGDDFFRAHFRPIMSHNSRILYQVSDSVLQPLVGSELLRNGSFEQLRAGLPVGWRAYGNPLIDTSGSHSHSGVVGAEVDALNGLTQRVLVKAGAVYLLKNCSLGTTPADQARLQVNWIGQDQRTLIRGDIAGVEATAEWKCHSFPVVAPSDAVWAEVYASVNDLRTRVWLDDLSFTGIQYK